MAHILYLIHFEITHTYVGIKEVGHPVHWLNIFIMGRN